MTFVRANETADGVNTVFTSSIPWQLGWVTPTINGRARTIEFTILSNTQIQYAEPPREGDTVAFLLNPLSS